MLKFENLLFDLDGKLTNPKLGLFLSIQAAIREMGRPVPSFEDLDWIVGPPIQHSIQELLQSNNEDDCRECLRLFRKRYSEVGLFENEVYAGIPGCLEGLTLAGYRLFVATGKPQSFAERIVARFQLDHFFVGVFGSRMDGSRIEKSDIIEDALLAHNLDPKTTVMIGDRKHDVEGARKHGIPCIGVLYGFGTRGELENAGAATMCVEPSDIPASIKRLELSTSTSVTWA